MFSMNWSLIARCSFRYTLVYAGLTVAAVVALTESELVLIYLFGLGFIVLLMSAEAERFGSGRPRRRRIRWVYGPPSRTPKTSE